MLEINFIRFSVICVYFSLKMNCKWAIILIENNLSYKMEIKSNS